MPRKLLNMGSKNASSLNLSEHKKINAKTVTKEGRIANILRKKRSKEYMEALRKLDIGNGRLSQLELDRLISTIRSEFPEVDLSGILEGYVSKCYLGGTYEVHTLNYILSIVTHYHSGEVLPGGMERARSLAKKGMYDYIEVYSDCCRAVSSNGNVSVIEV
ncbi:hypothetical protein [Companilactobacillus keshanensis]|uniref:Uncharacterized protein n=1 Tax=Companilactobacillus keshanensis TaxID=2486003 RepID=A0ABW4BUZ3_9LACO|nr:hypothetical protein [Companilactobacillus keshanensis]